MNYTDKVTGKTVKAKRVSGVLKLTNAPIPNAVRVKFDDGTHDDMDNNECVIRGKTRSAVAIVTGSWFVDGEGYMTSEAFISRYVPEPWKRNCSA